MIKEKGFFKRMYELNNNTNLVLISDGNKNENLVIEAGKLISNLIKFIDCNYMEDAVNDAIEERIDECSNDFLMPFPNSLLLNYINDTRCESSDIVDYAKENLNMISPYDKKEKMSLSEKRQIIAEACGCFNEFSTKEEIIEAIKEIF